MAIEMRLGNPRPLPPDEHVIHEQRSFRAITSTTWPSYHISFNIPLLLRMSLLVTNRRCLVRTDFLHFFAQDVSLWYPGSNPPDDPETITEVRSTDGLFGRCLEIRSLNPKRKARWLWSPELTLRFFMAEPEFLENLILGQIDESRGSAGKSP